LEKVTRDEGDNTGILPAYPACRQAGGRQAADMSRGLGLRMTKLGRMWSVLYWGLAP